jgi:hypothetical protein
MVWRVWMEEIKSCNIRRKDHNMKRTVPLIKDKKGSWNSYNFL